MYLLIEKLVAVYIALVAVSKGLCEVWEAKANKQCVCYAKNHTVCGGSRVKRIVVPSKINGGVTICEDCYNRLLEDKFFYKTLCNGDNRESKNTGFNTVCVVTDNLAEVCYLKLYGFGVFKGSFGSDVKGNIILAKSAVNAEETMRNIKPFYGRTTVYVNGVEVKDYETARNIAKMKIQQELVDRKEK